MTEEPEEEGYVLVLPFLTDDPQFCYGFECGLVWAAMKRGDEQIDNTYHLHNEEMLLLMAQRGGYDVERERLDDDWVGMTFTRKKA